MPTELIEDTTGTQLNRQIYLQPEELTANEANEKARPGEKPEDRARRVRDMAASIRQNGQQYAVKAVEIEDDGVVTYEYVDGGCRVEAIALLNDENKMAGVEPLKVWVTLTNPNADLFREALVSNIHRTQNSIMEMAHIVREVKERHQWKGRGAGLKVAEYLGLQPSRISEYDRIREAPKTVRDRIESGELTSIDAVLKLLSVPSDQLEEVAERSVQLAREEEAEQRGGESAPASARKKVTKVKAKHVAAAAREISQTPIPRNKTAILEWFESITEAAYDPPVVKWAEYLRTKYAAGEGTDRRLRELFDQMLERGKKRMAKKKGEKV